MTDGDNTPPEQLRLFAWAPAKPLRQADGSYLMMPPRPIARLSVKAFAAAVGCSRSTIYAAIGSDALPQRFMIATGKAKWLIQAEAVDHWLAFWAARRLG